MLDDDDLNGLSISSLREMCKSLKIPTAGFTEKRDFVEAIKADTQDVGMEDRADEDEEEDEEALLQQALLMSEESEDSLTALTIKDLRQRCAARGIATLGMTEKTDLISALLGEPEAEVRPVPSSALPAEEEAPPPGVQVVGRFAMPFACFAAVA